MRALVAEGNVVTRVTLRRLLERHGFAVEELRDELAAACLLYQPDPPDLALLSLDTLIVDFGQVCEAMRDAKPDIVIVALVPERRRADLQVVLDAGADDFLIKPASLQEAEARLQVVLRTLRVVGGSLLPETVEVQTGDDRLTRRRRLRLSLFLEEIDLSQTLTSLFEQFGLGPVRGFDAGADFVVPEAVSWAPMLLRQNVRAQWLNIRLGLDKESAERLCVAVHRDDRLTVKAIFSTLSDIVGLVQDAFGAEMLQYPRSDVYTPIAPIAVGAQTVPEARELASPDARRKQWSLAMGDGIRLQLSLTMEPVPLTERTVRDLKVLDVLAAPIKSDDYNSVLLRPGMMLDMNYINRVQALIHSKNHTRTVGVFRPPPGTSEFLWNLADRGLLLTDGVG